MNLNSVFISKNMFPEYLYIYAIEDYLCLFDKTMKIFMPRNLLMQFIVL